ncbi:MAG: hypothetical protein HP494_03220 [Nitrospira sp.]|nr:hypothetical protein [Nitrospira sp.]
MQSSRPILILFLIRAGVSGYHGWSHIHDSVLTTAMQNVFIGVVGAVFPIIALTLVLGRKLAFGYGVFSLAMLGSFVFGVCYHFVLDTPDLCSNVKSAHFTASAVLLAVVEKTGFGWGLYCWRSLIPLRSSGPPSASVELKR